MTRFITLLLALGTGCAGSMITADPSYEEGGETEETDDDSGSEEREEEESLTYEEVAEVDATSEVATPDEEPSDSNLAEPEETLEQPVAPDNMVKPCGPIVLPTTLPAGQHWYNTPEGSDLSQASQIRMSVTFRNVTGRSLTVDDIQLWSQPSVYDLEILESNFPIVAGISESDSVFTVEVTALMPDSPICETVLGIRLRSPFWGTMMPEKTELIAVSFETDHLEPTSP